MRDFPFSGVHWFFGIVESIMDPDELGRVQVRCFGVHTDTKEKSEFKGIPTEELIWAQVAGSPMDGRMHGIGKGPHKLVNGTQVAGIFVDGESAQLPIVLFTVGTLTPETKPDSTLGFSDPEGVYPKEDKLDTPHLNLLSGKDWQQHPVNQLLTDTKTELEPEQVAAPVYPDNQVFETKTGHIIEIDDTEGAERIRVIHRTGSYIEMRPDGTVVAKSVADSYDIVSGNRTLETVGNVSNTTRGNVDNIVEGSQTTTTNGTETRTITGHFKVKAPTLDLGEDGLEPMVLGDKLAAWAAKFAQWADTHQHIGNLGAPTSASIVPHTPDAQPAIMSGGDVYSTKNRTQ